MMMIEVEECKVRVERVEDRVVARMALTVAEECKVVGLELQLEEEGDRSVVDDPGEAGRFVENELEEGEEEEDDS